MAYGVFVFVLIRTSLSADTDPCSNIWGRESQRPVCPTLGHYPGPLPWLWPFDKETSGNVGEREFPEFTHIAKTGGGTIQ